MDDALLSTAARTLEKTQEKKKGMMTKEHGFIEWSKDHTPPLEYSKLAQIDFPHQNRHTHRPELKLPHAAVKPERSMKYLGIIIDQHLSWAQQQANAINKGVKWTSQIRRIVRTG